MDRVQVLDSNNPSHWKRLVLKINVDGVKVVSYWQKGDQLLDIFLVFTNLKVTLFCIEV